MTGGSGGPPGAGSVTANAWPSIHACIMMMSSQEVLTAFNVYGEPCKVKAALSCKERVLYRHARHECCTLQAYGCGSMAGKGLAGIKPNLAKPTVAYVKQLGKECCCCSHDISLLLFLLLPLPTLLLCCCCCRGLHRLQQQAPVPCCRSNRPACDFNGAEVLSVFEGAACCLLQ